MIEKAQRLNEPIAATVSDGVGILGRIALNSGVRGAVEIGENLNEEWTAFTQGPPGIPIDRNLSRLERMLPTWPFGRVIVLAGRPGCGKSCFARQVAHNAARQDFGVIFYSLEESRADTRRRIAARLANINWTRVQSRHLSEKEWTLLKAEEVKVSGLPLWASDRTMNLNELVLFQEKS